MMGARDDAAVAIMAMASLVRVWGVGEDEGSAGLIEFMMVEAAGRGRGEKTATREGTTITIVVGLTAKEGWWRVMDRGPVEAQPHRR